MVIFSVCFGLKKFIWLAFFDPAKALCAERKQIGERTGNFCIPDDAGKAIAFSKLKKQFISAFRCQNKKIAKGLDIFGFICYTLFRSDNYY